MSGARPYHGSLFAEDFLRGSISELPDWETVSEAALDEIEAELRDVFSGFPVAASPNESQTGGTPKFRVAGLMAIDAAVCVASGCCRGRLMMNLCPTRSKGLGGVRTTKRLDGVIVSARRTHLRNVSGVHPSSCAMEMVVDHCEEHSPSCSNTTRTACSRTSGQYLVLLFTTPSFHGTAKAQPIFFCSRRDCATRGPWPL